MTEDQDKKIKVGIDIRALRIAKTGARTNLEETCKILRKGHPDFIFYFIDTIIPVNTGKNKFLKGIEHIRFFIWKQITLPVLCRIKGCHIVFSTDYFAPLLRLNYKTAVVFYDAFFWEYPEQYNRIWLKLMNTFGVRAARNSTIITISEHSRKKIIQLLGIDPSRIQAIHLAPKSSSKQYKKQDSLLDADKKYILHVGVLEKRKNLPNLIKAFHLLIQEGYDAYYLVLVGSKIPKDHIDDSQQIMDTIAKLKLEERVILPGFVTDDQLSYYYRNATVYAFVSTNEGFGLPVLEAFQNNLPALISNNSCLPEIGGDAAITCNPYDVIDIKQKLQQIIDDKALQQTLITKGKQRLQDFSWEKSTNELLERFRQMHGSAV